MWLRRYPDTLSSSKDVRGPYAYQVFGALGLFLGARWRKRMGPGLSDSLPQPRAACMRVLLVNVRTAAPTRLLP